MSLFSFPLELVTSLLPRESFYPSTQPLSYPCMGYFETLAWVSLEALAWLCHKPL